MREEEMREDACSWSYSRSPGPKGCRQVRSAALHREPTGSSEALPSLPHTPGALRITSGRGVPWRSVQTLNPRLLVCGSAVDFQHPLKEFTWSEALCAAGNLVGQVFEVKVAQSLRPHGINSPWNSPGQNTGVGSCSLLQGIFQPRDRMQVSHTTGRFFTS